MFTVNESVRRAVGALAAAVESLSRGDLLSYDAIRELTGLDRTSPIFQTVVGKLKRKVLADRGVFLRAMSGDGYRLCDAAEQAGEVIDRRQKGTTRRIRLDYRIVEGVRPEELATDHQKRVRAFRLHSIEQQAAAFEEQRRLQAVIRRTEALPRLQTQTA